MILHSGVPQGSVLSPALFNFFVSDCPALADILTSYADDFSVLESDADLEALDRKLQEALAPITDWASRKKLTIAPAMSQVTPWMKQVTYLTSPSMASPFLCAAVLRSSVSPLTRFFVSVITSLPSPPKPLSA
jgi:hypothetical protein